MEEKLKKWFDEKLKVVGYPVLVELQPSGKYSNYDVIINVSDEFWFEYSSEIRQLGKDYYWFPMGETERDMGIPSMFGALWVMYQAAKKDKSILLHCHAGANRSPTIRSAFHFMMSEEHHDEKWDDGKVRSNMLKLNCGNHLPELIKMESWLKSCKEAFDNPQKFLGGMYDWTLRKSGLSVD
jgi:hypothetical protein